MLVLQKLHNILYERYTQIKTSLKLQYNSIANHDGNGKQNCI